MDARLEGGSSGGPAVILASPAQVWVEQRAHRRRLRSALYAEGEAGSNVGAFKVMAAERLEIHPGSASFFRHARIREGPAELKFRNGRITAITSLDHNMTALQSYWLEPEVITTLSGYARSEQHLVRYQEVPKALLDAVIATEDHRFFSHHGVNFFRIVRAALADLRSDGRLLSQSARLCCATLRC